MQIGTRVCLLNDRVKCRSSYVMTRTRRMLQGFLVAFQLQPQHPDPTMVLLNLGVSVKIVTQCSKAATPNSIHTQMSSFERTKHLARLVLPHSAIWGATEGLWTGKKRQVLQMIACTSSVQSIVDLPKSKSLFYHPVRLPFSEPVDLRERLLYLIVFLPQQIFAPSQGLLLGKHNPTITESTRFSPTRPWGLWTEASTACWYDKNLSWSCFSWSRLSIDNILHVCRDEKYSGCPGPLNCVWKLHDLQLCHKTRFTVPLRLTSVKLREYGQTAKVT